MCRGVPPGTARPVRGARHRADRAGGDGAADGERPPSRRRRRGVGAHTLGGAPHRDPDHAAAEGPAAISIAAYTTREDVESLLDVLPQALAAA
jgi:selenocysteine lyase/cysteine desulfurase